MRKIAATLIVLQFFCAINASGSYYRLFSFLSGSRKPTKVTLSPGSTSYTVPSGVYLLTVTACGGGGGGGAGSTYYGSTGGGGGGSGPTVMNISVTPGQVIPLQIGSGGNAGVAAYSVGGSGGQGGTTTFGTYITVAGGGGGSGGQPNGSQVAGGSGVNGGGNGGTGGAAYTGGNGGNYSGSVSSITSKGGKTCSNGDYAPVGGGGGAGLGDGQGFDNSTYNCPDYLPALPGSCAGGASGRGAQDGQKGGDGVIIVDPYVGWPTGASGDVTISTAQTFAPGTVLNYNNLTITSSGSINVSGGAGWIFIGVAGNLVLNGQINARNGTWFGASGASTSITANAPDSSGALAGEALSYMLTQARGGGSWNGGSAYGSDAYGNGGGGSAGGYFCYNNTGGNNGATFSGSWVGGSAGGASSSSGGTGAATTPSGTAGGAGATSTGGTGSSGSTSPTFTPSCTQQYPSLGGQIYNGSGGGGGFRGTPGQGVYLKVLGTITGSGTIDASGSSGGAGGAGGGWLFQ